MQLAAEAAALIHVADQLLRAPAVRRVLQQTHESYSIVDFVQRQRPDTLITLSPYTYLRIRVRTNVTISRHRQVRAINKYLHCSLHHSY